MKGETEAEIIQYIYRLKQGLQWGDCWLWGAT